MTTGTVDKYIMLPEPAEIIAKKQMTETEMYFDFKLDSGKPLGHKPGQFAEISVPGIGEAPISISSSPQKEESFEMVIRNAGALTAAIHAMDVGDKVGIRGPFGTDFPVENLKGKDLFFVAGGIGLVPARSAINYVLDNRDDYGNVTIFFGACDPSQRLFTDELEAWAGRDDITFLETVDACKDDWKGNVGVVTTLFPMLETQPEADKTYAIIVGPPIMYKFVIQELKKLNFADDHIIVSLERHMKCGIGKCGHCQINGIYVCQEGPVFSLNEITSLPEAI